MLEILVSFVLYHATLHSAPYHPPTFPFCTVHHSHPRSNNHHPAPNQLSALEWLDRSGARPIVSTVGATPISPAHASTTDRTTSSTECILTVDV